MFTKLAMDEWVKNLIKKDKGFRDKYMKMEANGGAKYEEVLKAAKAHSWARDNPGKTTVPPKPGAGKHAYGHATNFEDAWERVKKEYAQDGGFHAHAGNAKNFANAERAAKAAKNIGRVGKALVIGGLAASGASMANDAYSRWKKNKSKAA